MSDRKKAIEDALRAALPEALDPHGYLRDDGSDGFKIDGYLEIRVLAEAVDQAVDTCDRRTCDGNSVAPEPDERA